MFFFQSVNYRFEKYRYDDYRDTGNLGKFGKFGQNSANISSTFCNIPTQFSKTSVEISKPWLTLATYWKSFNKRFEIGEHGFQIEFKL